MHASVAGVNAEAHQIIWREVRHAAGERIAKQRKAQGIQLGTSVHWLRIGPPPLQAEEVSHAPPPLDPPSVTLLDVLHHLLRLHAGHGGPSHFFRARVPAWRTS